MQRGYWVPMRFAFQPGTVQAVVASETSVWNRPVQHGPARSPQGFSSLRLFLNNLFVDSTLCQACEDLGLPSNGSKEATAVKEVAAFCLVTDVSKPLHIRPGIAQSPHIRDRSCHNLRIFLGAGTMRSCVRGLLNSWHRGRNSSLHTDSE